MRRSTAVLPPCLPLAAMAACVASLGIDRLWITETGDAPLPFVAATVAAALHAAWILPAFRRDSPALIGLAWLTSVWACLMPPSVASVRPGMISSSNGVVALLVLVWRLFRWSRHRFIARR